MVVLKSITVMGVAIITMACSMQASSDMTTSRSEIANQPERYSLREISAGVDSLNGRLVAVRGYLKGFGPIMMLVENQESNPFETPSLLVSDTELRLKIISGNQFFDLKRYFDSLGCTDRFIDIVGEIGLIGDQESNGIVRIRTVTAFDDESFGDDGLICYNADADHQ